MRCLSLPLAPSREDYPPERGLFWAIGALEHKKPRYTLQIVCHSLQDILYVRSLKSSVAALPS